MYDVVVKKVHVRYLISWWVSCYTHALRHIRPALTESMAATLVHLWSNLVVQSRLDYFNYIMYGMSASSMHKLQSAPNSLTHVVLSSLVWRLRGNIIRTALCWVVWHSVHSQQHSYMSSSYRSSRLGLSHWDPYAMHRGCCLELYYCNMVEWSWLDSNLIWKTQLLSFRALTLLVWSYDL